MTTITVTTANICGNPIRAKKVVRARMTQALSIEGVTFGQECAHTNHFRIGRGNYSLAWHNISRHLGKVAEGGGVEVPVSVPSGYEVVSAQTVLAHTGKRLVSPNRYLTVVRTTVEAHQVAFVNCHTVSKPRRGVPFGAWRIRMYQAYLDKLRQTLAGLHGEGYTVVFGGDMNKTSVPQVHAAQQVLVSQGLDHLWIVPAQGVTWKKASTRKIPRTALMDHPILSATFSLA